MKREDEFEAGGSTPVMAASEILTKEQLAERLKVKVSWIYEQTRRRQQVRGNNDPLPHRKMGGRYLRFLWPEVVAWLDRQDGVKPQ